MKGGATAGGQRAAASHTGALASDDRIFDGVCRQAECHTAGRWIMDTAQRQKSRTENRADHARNQYEHRRQCCNAPDLLGNQHGNR